MANIRNAQMILLLILGCVADARGAEDASAKAAVQDQIGAGPVKVFILIGQSNMNGRGNIKMLREKLVKDLPQKYPPSLINLRKDVWITGANGNGISEQKDNKCLEPGFGQWKWYGPELGFGNKVGDRFDQQVLLVKIIAGGTSLGKDWASPTIARKRGRAIGPQYKRLLRETIETVQRLPELYKDYDPKDGYQICGAFWVQGHADGGRLRDEYEENLADFIGDVRKDLAVADLPFVAAESLAGKPPGEAYANAVERVNKAAGNKNAAAILSKSRIKLLSPDYKPYNAAGDTTHWRHNSRAYLDVGFWAADLMLPLVAKSVDHSRDAAVQAAWKTVLPKVLEQEPKK